MRTVYGPLELLGVGGIEAYNSSEASSLEMLCLLNYIYIGLTSHWIERSSNYFTLRLYFQQVMSLG